MSMQYILHCLICFWLHGKILTSKTYLNSGSGGGTYKRQDYANDKCLQEPDAKPQTGLQAWPCLKRGAAGSRQATLHKFSSHTTIQLY